MSYEGVFESIPLQYRPVSSVTVDGIDSSNRSILDQEAGLNNSPNSRPIRAAGRRKTEFLYRQGAYSAVTDEENEGEDEAKATPVAEFFQKMIRFSVVTRFALYIIPVAVVLAIPIVLMATAFKGAVIEDIRLTGLFVWIELVWLNVWLAILMAYILPFIFQFFGGFISSGSRKYAQLLKAVILPMSVFIWAMISRAATPVICAFDSKEDRKHLCDDQWILVLRRVLLATIAVTGIFFVEKIMIHLVSVSYRRRQFNLKLMENKRFTHILSLMYEESRKLFPMHCPEFAAEDFKIADSSNAPLALRTSSEVDPFSRVENRISAAMSGAASRFTGKRILKAESAQSIVLQAFGTRAASEALARRLWMSFVRDGKGELYEKDIANVLGPDGKDEATAIFEALDKDCNGGVSLEEMHLLCLQIGQDRKYINRSMHDIGQVIKSLDNILSFIVLLLTILVYAAFFSTALASRVTVLWGSVAAMSFAIAGIVQEFLGSCVFIFIKHPYDVGDRVDINNVQLIIEHISLLSTIFRQVDSGASIQIPNIVNNSQWIKNISRSKAMAERYDFSINAKTKFDAIENLKIELQSFSRDNKRDFQPEVDIELISLGNLSEIVLRVEICHKSNWSNETLRAIRRNKFLCAILTALRKHSISSPGGGDAPLVGSWENPSYSVTITDEEAQGARAAHEAKEEEKRMEKLNADAPKSGGTSTTTSAEISPGAPLPFAVDDAANVLLKGDKWRKAASTVREKRDREHSNPSFFSSYPQADEDGSFRSTTQAVWDVSGARHHEREPGRVSADDEETFNLHGCQKISRPPPHRTPSDASSTRALIQPPTSYQYQYKARPGYGPRAEQK